MFFKRKKHLIHYYEQELLNRKASRDRFIIENLKLCNEIRLLNKALARKNKLIKKLRNEKSLQMPPQENVPEEFAKILEDNLMDILA